MILKIRPFLLIAIATSGVLISCNRVPDAPWPNAVSELATALIVPETNTTITTVSEKSFVEFLNQSSAFPLETVGHIENVTGYRLLLKGLVIYPASANEWAPVWITHSSNRTAADIGQVFKRPFTENSYRFKGVRIHKLHPMEQGQKMFFSAQLGNTILISPNSFAIEESISSYLGKNGRMDLPTEPAAGAYYLNISSLDIFLKMYGAVRFRPIIKNAFEGMGSTVLEITTSEGRDDRNNYHIRMSTNIATSRDGQKSALTRAVSSRPLSFTTDRLISADAAIMSQFIAPEHRGFSEAFTVTALDSSLIGQPGLISALQAALDSETAFAGFNTSGFSALEETVFIRKAHSGRAVRAELDRLAERGHIQKEGDFYAISSRILGSLLGSDLCPYTHFYAGFHNDYVILAPRTGLVQRIINDAQRRRAIYYEDGFSRLRQQQSGQLSAFLYINSRDFRQFIEPFTDPVSSPWAFLDFFDILMLGTEANSSADKLDISLHTYAVQQAVLPYADRWFYPLEEDIRLTGQPVAANLLSADRSDIIFSTTGNRVVALAPDGTEIFRAGTANDLPVGSPIVYDWYANNQMAVLVGAGNKIYAWNNRGTPLPNFPIVLDEQITSPIMVSDVTRSGLPEIIVTTADRNTHILNARGVNITGWPQRTHNVVRHQPVHTTFSGDRVILAHAGNGLFAWDNQGNLVDGFPVFTDTPLNGSPYSTGSAIISGGVDGRMYVYGSNIRFNNQTSRTHENGVGNAHFSLYSISVAESPIVIGGVKEVSIRDEFGQTDRTPSIFMQSKGGSVFMYTLQGELLFAESMGQPSADNHIPVIIDITGSNREEMIIVAEFGRMYAWNILTKNRIDTLPADAVHHPLFTRLARDTQISIIAGTRDGVAAWTILR